jgi:hypothetical protein
LGSDNQKTKKGSAFAHRNPKSFARRSVLEKRDIFSADLFCAVKRSFVDP